MFRNLMMLAVLCAGLMFVSNAQAGWGRGPHFRNVSYHPHGRMVTRNYSTSRWIEPNYNYNSGTSFVFFGR
ncbi:hypothetical protein GC197_17925 [bacterium]|nr:hypothetical protein [bacterium]